MKSEIKVFLGDDEVVINAAANFLKTIVKFKKENPTSQAPTAQVPTAQAPTAQAPTAQAPTAQVPTAQAPTSQAPTAQAPTAQAPTAQAPTAQAPTAQVPTAQAPTAQAPTAQVPTAQAPTAQAPAPTINEVREVVKSRTRTHMRGLTALLESYKARTISDIPPTDYADFIAAVEALEPDNE